ncbi:MAG: SNF2 family helicase [Spirochaetia bacterium]|nr:SNF2 family helicase [Spirochaetia bacterium]
MDIIEIFKEFVRQTAPDTQDISSRLLAKKAVHFIDAKDGKAHFIADDERFFRVTIDIQNSKSRCSCFQENTCSHVCAAAFYMISNPLEFSRLNNSIFEKGEEPFLSELGVQINSDCESFHLLLIKNENAKFIKNKIDFFKLKENYYGILNYLPEFNLNGNFSYDIKLLHTIVTNTNSVEDIKLFSSEGIPLNFRGCINAELSLAQKPEKQFFIEADFINPKKLTKKIILSDLLGKEAFPFFYSFDLEKKLKPAHQLINYYSGLYQMPKREKEPIIQKNLRKKIDFYFVLLHEKHTNFQLSRWNNLSHLDLIDNKESFITNEIKNTELIPEKWNTSAELVLLISPDIIDDNLELKCEFLIAYASNENIIKKLNFSDKGNAPVIFFAPTPVSLKQEGYTAAKIINKNICVYRDHQKESRLFEPKISLTYSKTTGGFRVSENKIKNFILNTLPTLKERNINIGIHKDITTLFQKKYTALFHAGSSSGMSWFNGEIKINGLSEEDRKALFNAVKKNKEYFRLISGRWLSLEDIGLSEILKQTEKLGLKITQNFKVEKISTGNLIALDEFLELKSAKRTKNILKNIKGESEVFDIKYEDPGPNFNGNLRPYQKTGVAFFRKLFERHLGGIMADDMGLGKTIQTLSFLNKLYYDYPKLKPSLLVTPLSALSVWENESSKFFSRLSIYKWHGKDKNVITAKKSNIILTTYATLSQNHDFFKTETFTLMCLDEAQTIKNYASKASTSIRKMKIERIFALTGTPIENSLTDLWSLFDLSVPGLLGTRKSFLENYDDNNFSQDGAYELKRLIKPFLLRRHKDDVVKDLPSKTISDIPVLMTSRQKALHEKVRRDALKALENSEKNHIFTLLPYLMTLRRIACHPDLKKENNWDISSSGKFEYLRTALPELYESASGVLIFSQFTDVLNLVAELLNGFNFAYFYLDGSVSHKKRKEQVELFQKGERKFFLISLKAGASALTLHQADTIIHLDPWWNPQLENQATDRAYRIGQKRKVFVYRLFSKDSIEERVLELKEKKQKLFDAIFTGKSFKKNMHITKDEIINLLSND